VFTRVELGRARVVREVRAAAPLMADLKAPLTARGPWLTAVLNEQSAGRLRGRPAAVMVEAHAQGRPEALALLTLRRRGVRTRVTLLGDGVVPVPGGRPPFRVLARDDAMAELLADAVVGLLRSLRGPWSMRLDGLPLGDPVARALAARLPASLLRNRRSRVLVDDLDAVGDVRRTRNAAELERWLPRLLTHAPGGRARGFLRAAARLHAAIGQLELAVIDDGGELRAGLLTLVDGTDRWPWWGWSSVGGLGSEMGAPLVRVTSPVRRWP